MDDVLREALEPILRDLRRHGLAEPTIEHRDWTGVPEQPGVMLWAPDGSGTGASVRRVESEAERIAAMADQVQEWAIEELWADHASTGWPPCPHHPDSHPLTAAARDQAAVWACPVDGNVVAPIGALRPE